MRVGLYRRNAAMAVPGAVLAILGLTACTALAACPECGKGSAALETQKVELVREVIEQMIVENHIPGASVAIGLDQAIVYAEGFGYADVENGVETKTLTAFRTASVGKAMTATAVMRLVEDGVLDLHEDVQTYCPQFPKKKEGRITIHHLLAHQSGIRHYGGENDYEEQYNTTHYDSVTEALEIFAEDPLVHSPGAEWTYSTFGYNVLGCVVEGALGVPFLDAMAALVFDPVGMADTRDDDPRALIPNRAGGYVWDDGTLSRAIPVDMSSKMPAGGYITTAVDLAKFAIAVQSGHIISRETFERMITDKSLQDGRSTGFGYGWAVSFPDDLWYGYKEVLHGGSTPGVANLLYMLPQRQFTVAIMTNQQLFRGRVPYAEKIAEIVLDLESNE